MTQPRARISKDHAQFREDMTKAGFRVVDYRGRFAWSGPAVYTDREKGPQLQDVIRTTTIRLQWDCAGLDHIVHPKAYADE